MRTLTVLLAAGTAASQAPDYAVPNPSSANFVAWRNHILPTDAELAWAEIPWLQSFGEGMLAADRETKPLLLWAMNGHPLGCT